MKNCTLSKLATPILSDIHLTASKSEANRALIIRALSGQDFEIRNIAKARDTDTMMKLLADPQNPTWDVLDAGTTMRFLTAFAAIKGLPKLMTGSSRMQERPIGILVDALRELGAEISYEKVDGYPPHRIHGFEDKGVKRIQIRGDVSSQYISAILMVSPLLKNGLELELTGKIGSLPYIQMTLNQMKDFGVESSWDGNVIKIANQSYKGKSFSVEADWSAASYWYSIVALSENAEVKLFGLKPVSSQGDSVLVQLMEILGVKSEFFDGGVKLTKIASQSKLVWDFTHCPDIAQTIAVICAVKGVDAHFSGLESLRIKETDRIEAIRAELEKFGVVVEVIGDEEIKIAPKQSFDLTSSVTIATYKDHRMAMAFAPLAAVRGNLEIENMDVVNKSYPDYWSDLEKVGFKFEIKEV